MNIKAVEIIHSGIQVDNLELFKKEMPDVEKFIKTTGIQYRYIAPKEHHIEDYFIQGIRNLKCDFAKIDVLITVTQTPTKLIPSLSSYILTQIEFEKSIVCFDLTSGCSGYTEALSLANQLFQTANYNQIIICNGDFSSHIISEKNHTVLPLFSDIAAVTLLENNAQFLFASNRQSFPQGYQAINSESGLMTLNGLAVFENSVQHTAHSIEELLSENQIDINSVDLFCFHQANMIINKTIVRQLMLPLEKTPFSILEYGNSSSASIPLTWCVAKDKLKDFQQILLSGFGVGFKICNVVMETTNFNTNISVFENN